MQKRRLISLLHLFSLLEISRRLNFESSTPEYLHE